MIKKESVIYVVSHWAIGMLMGIGFSISFLSNQILGLLVVMAGFGFLCIIPEPKELEGRL